ncbi:peroxiredoxin [Rheinheimera soli]|uniref:Glutathione-dependent peroxiredoxin n=1 Tax=Rheinheimera soli TaxID=443616 RepID=A0ABU1W4C2_9GAMM|nr:peroxiredoxin [Rheinheimera soli]MDR7122801.1 peroxiredoxin [Rheinheimera soli]
MIKIGDTLPDVTFARLTDNGPVNLTTAEVFKGEKVVLFAVPGAFTPTCSAAHLPGFIELAQQFFDKGVDRIICTSVNDAYVMDAWSKAHNATDIVFLADGAAKFAKAVGLDADTGDFGGVRSKRYAMIVDNCVVKALNVDEPKQFEVSKAEVMVELV